MWNHLTAYPVASVSAVVFYAALLALAVPSVRRWLLPPVGREHLAGFDAIRGLTAALVAVDHSWYFTGGLFDRTVHVSAVLEHLFGYAHKSVPIFTVLSGFLIYRAVLGIGSLEGLRAYVIRRVFRLYPVYALGVALSLGFGLYYGGQNFSKAAFGLAELFMMPPLGWGSFRTPEVASANPVLWSLFVEVTFYAALPLFVVAVGRRRIVPATLLALAVFLAVEPVSRSFGLWKYFAIGILASELAPRVRSAAGPLAGLGIGLLVLDFLGPEYDWASRLGIANGRAPAGETLGLGLACGLILAALPGLGRIARALDAAPLRLLGAMSYSVYIIHSFFILAAFPEIGTFANAKNLVEHFRALPAMPAWYLPFVFLPGIFFWGLVSFLLIERPGIRFGKRLIGRPRPAAVLMVDRRSA